MEIIPYHFLLFNFSLISSIKSLNAIINESELLGKNIYNITAIIIITINSTIISLSIFFIFLLKKNMKKPLSKNSMVYFFYTNNFSNTFVNIELYFEFETDFEFANHFDMSITKNNPFILGNTSNESKITSSNFLYIFFIVF